MERPGSRRSKRLLQQHPEREPARVIVSDTGAIELRQTVIPESFEGQLEWRRQFSAVPMTSTPVQKQKVLKTKTAQFPHYTSIQDVEMSIVSPIQKPDRRVAGRQALAPIHNFDELLYKYGDGEDQENERELLVHVERTKAKTYRPVTQKQVPQIVRFKVKEEGKAIQENVTKRIKKKTPAVSTKVPSKEDKLNPDAVDWIKKTNEEFASIMNFDLCVEKH